MAERSKAPDSSSGGAILVGSNPTAVIFNDHFQAAVRFQPSLNETSIARLAQLVERKALNLVVVGSSPTVGALSSLVHVRGSHPSFLHPHPTVGCLV